MSTLYNKSSFVSVADRQMVSFNLSSFKRSYKIEIITFDMADKKELIVTIDFNFDVYSLKCTFKRFYEFLKLGTMKFIRELKKLKFFTLS